MLKSNPNNRVFIYALLNPITNNIFYVGATIRIKSRHRQHHCKNKLHKGYRAEQIKSLLDIGQKAEMVILAECGKNEAKNEEEFYISLLKFYGFRLEQKEKSTYSLDNIKLSDIEIVQCLADGLRTKQIALKAQVCAKTIEKRLDRLKNKNKARNSVHLMSMFFRKKLIT